MIASKLDKKTAAGLAFALTFLGGPVLMAKEEWDDHDRSGKFTARDFAADYLNSCAPKAILFTNGDNDTFPLWYVGMLVCWYLGMFDVRVCLYVYMFVCLSVCMSVCLYVCISVCVYVYMFVCLYACMLVS